MNKNKHSYQNCDIEYMVVYVQGLFNTGQLESRNITLKEIGKNFRKKILNRK